MRDRVNPNREARLVARIGSLVALFFCAWAAAEPSLELTVESTNIAMGDEINAQVTLHGAQRAAEPQIEGLTHFTAERHGTSSQVQIINGSTSMSVVFNYVLIPKNAGTFIIGPATVNIGGKEYQSNHVQIKVVPASQNAAQPSGNKPFQVLAEVDRPQAYVGQQVIYTFQFLSRGQMVNASLNLPDFKGFLKEELGKQRQFETVKDGVRWSVTEIKIALFPTQAGDKTIEIATLDGEAPDDSGGGRRRSPIDDFFDSPFFSRGRMKRVHLQSPGLIVKVLDLPPGKPQGFSGVVGSVDVKQSLSKQSVAVGDSVTWTVEISGDGNLRDARWEPPALAGFKVYDDQPAFQPRGGARVGGTKTFKKALVPLEGGKRELPALEVPYFDPEKGGYRVAKAPPVSLEVAPGQVGTLPPSSAPARQAVAVRGEDILAPRWERDIVTADALTGPERRTLALVWALGPILFGGLGFGLTWRRRRSGDQTFVRRSRAFGGFRKASAKWNGSASFDLMDGALRQYLGDRFNTDGGALTPLDVQEKLSRFGVKETWVKEAKEVLDLCERARYGGGGDPAAVRERVVKLVEGLEKENRA